MIGIWKMGMSWVFPKFLFPTCSFFKEIMQVSQPWAHKKPSKFSRISEAIFLILELREKKIVFNMTQCGIKQGYPNFSIRITWRTC